MTNFEKKIKELTVEDMVDIMFRCNYCGNCPAEKNCNHRTPTCKQKLRQWLNSEVENDKEKL